MKDKECTVCVLKKSEADRCIWGNQCPFKSKKEDGSLYEQIIKTGRLRGQKETWEVHWDDKERGVLNLSLPVHPDQIWQLPLDNWNGKAVEFSHVFHCDSFKSYDCAKIHAVYPSGIINNHWYIVVNH